MLKLGLIGAANVAKRAFAHPSTSLAGIVVIGVAASDPERAERFAQALNLKHVWRNYSSLINDPFIDAVYIALHNSAHVTWAINAVNAGKHVLVEKPLCMTVNDIDALRKVVSRSDVVVREAILTSYHPWLKAVRDVVTGGELGRLQQIEAHFVFNWPEPTSYRCHPELGGGIFWDAAPYWIQIMQTLIGPIVPKALRGVSEFDGPNGIDATFSAQLLLDGIDATLNCSFGERQVAELLLTFDDGTVRHSHLLRPALAPFRVNLHLYKFSTGERRVVSFMPEGYSSAVFNSFAKATREGQDTEYLISCRERIGILEALFHDARQRHHRPGAR